MGPAASTIQHLDGSIEIRQFFELEDFEPSVEVDRFRKIGMAGTRSTQQLCFRLRIPADVQAGAAGHLMLRCIKLVALRAPQFVVNLRPLQSELCEAPGRIRSSAKSGAWTTSWSAVPNSWFSVPGEMPERVY